MKSIGVSQFKPRHLERLLDIAYNKPVVNEIELHPLYVDHETIAFCKKNDILIVAYSPLAGYNKIMVRNEVIWRIAQKNRLFVSQIVLSYLLSKGYIIIPRSSQEKHIASNIQLENIHLS